MDIQTTYSKENEILRITTTRADAKAFYNRLSRFYDLLTERSEGPLRTRGLNLLGAHPGETILEVGVGTGHALLALAKAVGAIGRVHGVDISEGMVERARAKLAGAELSSRTNLVVADAMALPFKSETMDGIFMSFTLELFDTPDIPKVLEECRRVLRTKGRIVVVGLSRKPGATLPVRIYEWGHRHFSRLLDCRPIYVERALREAGFAIERADQASVAGIPVEVVLARKS